MDQRGYGDSEKPEGVKNYKIELLIEDIRALIQELGKGKIEKPTKNLLSFHSI